MLAHVIKRTLLDNHDLDLTEPEDRETLETELIEALATTMFGPRVLLGQPGEPPRKGKDLYEAAQTWIGTDAVEIGTVTVEDEAVELGEGAYLGWEALDSGESRPVLGYDIPGTGRFYYHRFHPDTRVWATAGGLVLIAHTDLLLTPYGLDEEAPGGSEDEDDPHHHPDEPGAADDVELVPVEIPEGVLAVVVLPEKPVSHTVEAEVIAALGLDEVVVTAVTTLTGDVALPPNSGDVDGLLTGDFLVYMQDEPVGADPEGDPSVYRLVATGEKVPPGHGEGDEDDDEEEWRVEVGL